MKKIFVLLGLLSVLQASLAPAQERPQRKRITALVDQQRAALGEIVTVRRAISTELRRFQNGQKADAARVASLSRRYGELDGDISWRYAEAFAEVGRSLGAEQKAALARLRTSPPGEARGPFLYSQPLQGAQIDSGNRFFLPR